MLHTTIQPRQTLKYDLITNSSNYCTIGLTISSSRSWQFFHWEAGGVGSCPQCPSFCHHPGSWRPPAGHVRSSEAGGSWSTQPLKRIFIKFITKERNMACWGSSVLTFVAGWCGQRSLVGTVGRGSGSSVNRSCRLQQVHQLQWDGS